MRKYICEKIPNKFVINKFYLYICINKTKAGADADGRAEFRKANKEYRYVYRFVYYHQPNSRGLAQITGERLCIYTKI